MKVPNFVAIRKLNLFIASANNMAGTTHTRVFNTTWLFSGRTLFGFNRKDNEKNVYKESWKKKHLHGSLCQLFCELIIYKMFNTMHAAACNLGNIYFFQVVKFEKYSWSGHMYDECDFIQRWKKEKKKRKKKYFFVPFRWTQQTIHLCVIYIPSILWYQNHFYKTRTTYIGRLQQRSLLQV